MARKRITLEEFLEAAREVGVDGLWLGSMGGCVLKISVEASGSESSEADRDGEDVGAPATPPAEPDGSTKRKRKGAVDRELNDRVNT